MSSLFATVLGQSVSQQIHEWSRPKGAGDYSDSVSVHDMTTTRYHHDGRTGLASTLPWSNMLLKNANSSMYSFSVGRVEGHGSAKHTTLLCLLDRYGRVHATALGVLEHRSCDLQLKLLCVGSCVASSDLSSILPSCHRFSVCETIDLNPHERSNWNSLRRHIQHIARPVIRQYMSGSVVLHEVRVKHERWGCKTE